MKWVLTDVLIDSVQWNGGENADTRPLEEVMLDYQALDVYVAMAHGSVDIADGSVHFLYNFSTGRAG